MPIEHVPLDTRPNPLAAIPAAVSEKVGKLVGVGLKSPFVRIRCGEANLIFAQTLPDKRGEANPKWDKDLRNVLKVKRPLMGVGTPTDSGKLVVEVWDDNKKKPDVYIGGALIPLAKYLDAPGRDFDEEFEMLAGGDPGEDTRHVGQIKVKIKWIPQGSDDERVHGELEVTVFSGSNLKRSDKVIRDLSTYTDWVAIYGAFLSLIVYLLIGYYFYTSYVSKTGLSDLKATAQGAYDESVGKVVEEILDTDPAIVALEQKVSGGNGQWDAINTWVFMITSFTTVGYGNQPSLTATTPPCQYPHEMSYTDDPYSELMPYTMHMFKEPLKDEDRTLQFKALDPSCFDRASTVDGGQRNQSDSTCWVIMDDEDIYDFGQKLLYKRFSRVPPQNFSAAPQGLLSVTLPGTLRQYDCDDAKPPQERRNESIQQCFERHTRMCDRTLMLWRNYEGMKDNAKIFTSLFVMVGIGILGVLAGAVGDKLLEIVEGIFEATDLMLDTLNDGKNMVPGAQALEQGLASAGGALKTGASNALEVIAPGEKVDRSKVEKDLYSESATKGLLVAMLGLCLFVGIGVGMYGWMEKFKLVDAIYFTVVTTTTVGFGDYCPETQGGKAFTLFFVPISVVVTASSINHIAAIPLRSRAIALEQYVISQFSSEKLTSGDFQDIRRSAGIASDDPIRGNDFVLAMLIRLGTIKTSDMIRLRALFTVLDKNGNGSLEPGDIQGLIEEGHRSEAVLGLSSPTRVGMQEEDDSEGFDNPLAANAAAAATAGKRKDASGNNLQPAMAAFETEERPSGGGSGDAGQNGAEKGAGKSKGKSKKKLKVKAKS